MEYGFRGQDHHRNLYILQILDSNIALSVRIYLVFDTLAKCI